MSAPDIDVMKRVNRRFVSGVTVVTTIDNGVPLGLAVSAYSSISLTPPSVLVCVQQTSNTHDPLFRSDYLAINILSIEQLDVVKRFSSKDTDKFSGLDWSPGEQGCPLLARSAATLEARIDERHHASTHTIFICSILAVGISELPPMVYSEGAFFDGGALKPL